MPVRIGSARLWLTALAHGDFPAAMSEYKGGHFEVARAQFLTLAELGDAASQFNLGAMAMQGQGGAKDPATAVGWLTAAADNGSTKLAPDKLAALRAKLTDEQRKTADDIAARYGRAGLQQTVLPVPPLQAYCRDLAPPRPTYKTRGESEFYPAGGRRADQNGLVILQLTVGVDGVPRDPEILMSVPTADFSAAAIDSWMPSRWTPARRQGKPVESKVTVKVVFMPTGGGVLWDVPALKAIRETALTGDPSAQYHIGLAATLDGSLGIPESQAFNLLVSAAQGGNPQAQYWVATRFASVGSCGVEKKKLPWLRAAAGAGDGAAQLALAMDLIDGQPSAQQLADARALLEEAAQSDNFYVRKHVAALMAASPLEALRDPATAKAVADRLMKNPIGADPQAYEAAAAAYAANRDFWTAAKKQEWAIKKAVELQWNTQLMEQRLALYRKSQPWTGDLFGPPPVPSTPPTSSR